MLGFTSKKALEEMSVKLTNAQEMLNTQTKKTKQAVIIGGSTTAAAAVVAGVLHFGLGRGNKKVKEKINNYDLIIEERNKALEDVADLTTKYKHATNMAIASDGCCQKLANSIRTKNSEEMHAAMEDHKAIHKEIFGDISDESFNAAVAAYDAFVKTLENSQQQPQNPAPQNPQPQNPQPQNPAPQNPAPQNPAPQNPAPQNPAPQNPQPQNNG